MGFNMHICGVGELEERFAGEFEVVFMVFAEKCKNMVESWAEKK